MNKKKHRKLSFPIVLAVTVFLISAIPFLKNITFLSETTAQTQAASLKNALTRSAIHCYATEGRYPESLEYLQEEYGICWDSEQYTVDYEVFASNLLPTISVIPLS